jgi:hypothetical protein
MEVTSRRGRAKVFGEGPAQPMDRNLKVRITVYARAYNARHKQPGQHIGPITRTFQEVLKALLWGFHNAASGRCFPSYEAIAAKAGCARSSVYEAIQVLGEARILSWVNRLAIIRDKCIDAAGKTVWHPRIIRTSNAYVFHDPVENRGKPPNSPKSENRAGSSYQDSFDSSLTVGRPPEPGDKWPGTGIRPDLRLA